MKCPACGEENVSNAKFCAFCGKKLSFRILTDEEDEAPQRRHMPVIAPPSDETSVHQADETNEQNEVFLFDDEKADEARRRKTLESEKAMAKKRIIQQRNDDPFYGEDEEDDEDDVYDDDDRGGRARMVIMIVASVLTVLLLVGVAAFFLFGTKSGSRLRATYGFAASYNDYYDLARWQRENANYTEAAETYNKAFLLNRDDYDFDMSIAQALESCGALERAEKLYLYLIDHWPEKDGAYDYLMALLLREGKRDQYNGLIELRKTNQPSYSAPAISTAAPGAPEADPAGGNFTGSVSIALYSQDGADIYFSLDGTDPTTASRRYTEPIKLYTGTYTLRAIAIKDGVFSPIMKETYSIS